MRLTVLVILIVMALAFSGCTIWSEPAETSDPDDTTEFSQSGETDEPTDPPAARAVEVVQVDRLTQAVPVPGSDGDLLLLERGGGVLLLESGAEEPEGLLDLSDRVDPSGERERGLKGLVFHPDFEENGILFFTYDDTIDPEEDEAGYGQVTRFIATDPGDLSQGLEEADVVLEVDFKLNWWHNMAGIKFGPDGLLYVGIGDGGGYRKNAQDLSNLKGTILRLDVDSDEGYEIPEDNPFVGESGSRDEIWLYGLRNPWRFDFHPGTGDLFIANAGELDVESVYLFPGDGDAPRNHGWPYWEGNQTLETHHDDIPPESEINFPVVNFITRNSTMCAIIGGAVYQGDHFPALRGKFVFADHCTSQLMFAENVDGEWILTPWFSVDGAVPTSVDLDEDGEILVVGLSGRLHRIVPE